MARDWLEVVDSIDRATRMDVAPENPMAEGLRRVLEQIEALLDRYGIERIDAIGEPFDPERHEAVGVRESEQAPPNTVVAVARSGYTIGDRLLRPAQVIVARRPATEG
jgi:molecular chaperone GrpE